MLAASNPPNLFFCDASISSYLLKRAQDHNWRPFPSPHLLEVGPDLRPVIRRQMLPEPLAQIRYGENNLLQSANGRRGAFYVPARRNAREHRL